MSDFVLLRASADVPALLKSTTPVRKENEVSKKFKLFTKSERKKLRKLVKAVSPTPFATGAGGPITKKSTAWSAADRFAQEVRRTGTIPAFADGESQRELLLGIVRLRDKLKATRDPIQKSIIGEQLTKLQLVAAHELALKGPYGVGNSGDISARDERSGVTAVGDLAALHRAMDAGAIASVYRGGPQPRDDFGDDDLARRRIGEAAAAEAEMAKTSDPLARDALGQDATVAKLSALRRMSGAGSAISAIERQRQRGQVAKSDRVAHLARRLDRLSERLEKASEPTTRAEIDEARRAVAAELTLERLKQAHRRLEI